MNITDTMLVEGQALLNYVKDFEAQMIEAGLADNEKLAIAMGLMGRLIAREKDGFKAEQLAAKIKDNLLWTTVAMRGSLMHEARYGS